jgi:hypothetical protein
MYERKNESHAGFNNFSGVDTSRQCIAEVGKADVQSKTKRTAPLDVCGSAFGIVK